MRKAVEQLVVPCRQRLGSRVRHADPTFDRHRRPSRTVGHRGADLGREIRIPHQRCAKGAGPCNPVARAAAVQVDRIVPPLPSDCARAPQHLRVGPAQLQDERVLGVCVVVQEPRQLRRGAVHEGVGVDHLRVQRRTPRHSAEQVPQKTGATLASARGCGVGWPSLHDGHELREADNPAEHTAMGPSIKAFAAIAVDAGCRVRTFAAMAADAGCRDAGGARIGPLHGVSSAVLLVCCSVSSVCSCFISSVNENAVMNGRKTCKRDRKEHGQGSRNTRAFAL
eukprot:scaffold17755_cov129-Isochrysis_galbana.AAC.3